MSQKGHPYLPLRATRRKITLRLRLALLSTALLIVLSSALVLFINLTASLTAPDTASTGAPIPPNLVQRGLPLSSPQEVPKEQEHPGAGQLSTNQLRVTPTPIRVMISSQPVSAAETIDIREHVLAQLRLVSVIGLALLVGIGAVSAYWVAGRALRPLSEVSRAARQISASTLDTRIDLKSPEDEIKELAEAFDAMLGRLQFSFTQQGQFVSNAAHELRTPLTTLRTNVEVAYTDPDASLDDYREMAPVLDRTLTRLERLVSDLLLMAAGEKSLVMEDVALASLVSDVLLDLAPAAERQGITVAIGIGSEDVTISGDGPLLARVFSNLIENGIRYNQSGGSVSIEVHRDQDSTHALVEIVDTGSGIPESEQAKVFDRFYRMDQSRSRHRGGAGLGLSIVAHIVQMHRGQVTVESKPGVGSRFTVRIPV